MIREPTVGMRVQSTKGMHVGKFGKITRVESNGRWVWVDVDWVRGDSLWPYEYQMITEIKESGMKKGDLVKLIIDVSAVKVYNDNMYKSKICNTEAGFCILHIVNNGTGGVFIKAVTSGSIYLVSMEDIEPKAPKVKELTVADIEEKYGCKVKIVKE